MPDNDGTHTVVQLGAAYWCKAEADLRHLRELATQRPYDERRFLWGAVLGVEHRFYEMKALLEQQEQQVEFLLRQHEKMSQKYIDHLVDERMRAFYAQAKFEGERTPDVCAQKG